MLCRAATGGRAFLTPLAKKSDTPAVKILLKWGPYYVLENRQKGEKRRKDQGFEEYSELKAEAV